MVKSRLPLICLALVFYGGVEGDRMIESESGRTVYDIAMEVADEVGDRNLKQGLQQFKDHQSVQVARAKAVFDELTNGLPDQPNDDKHVDYLDFLSDRLNKVIVDNLDAHSIHEFLLLCGVSIADLRASIAGSARADRRHSMPGGSRDKKQQIRDIWASGKYSDRDLCATQECDALQMSWSTARKALRNTLAPVRDSKKTT